MYGDKSINVDKAQLYDGACADPVTSPYFENFADNPWGDLIEAYYQCVMFPTDAFFNALGIASGTVDALVPKGIISFFYVILGLVALFSWTPGARTDEENGGNKSQINLGI